MHRYRHRNALITLALSVAAMLLPACSSIPQVEERFSETTATTWRVAGDTMVFERTEARYSRSGRDYVYLGPVALNRRGTYEYLLWIGVGTTLDRGFLAPEASMPESISLFIDGEPVELPVMDWSRLAPALAQQIPYAAPVALQWNLAARVTRDQIALIDARGIEELLVHTPDGGTREFLLWGDRTGWQAFVDSSP